MDTKFPYSSSTDYKVDCVKSFYEIKPDLPSIGLVMMIKNEAKRILVSLKSIKGFVEALIIFDTGSTDNTLDIIKDFSEKNKINLYLIRGEFINFSTSRNVVLDYADTIPVKYLLLLDCNDELKGGELLKKFVKNFKELTTGFLMCQKWWSGQHDKYYNIRFVKNNSGWRYFGSVHEWMKDTTREGPDPAFPVFRISDEIFLYQDRTKDDDKTSKRFHRDRQLLLEDYKKNPKDPRTVFYLAQTCECLQKHDEAFYYSKIRLDLGGFDEEIFHSLMRCGQSALSLGHDWGDVTKWFLKAYEKFNRAEPLVKLADHYRHNKLWHMAYMYIRQACELAYPTHLILFVDSGIYEYYRWHVMGIVAFYVNKLEEGKHACLIAIQKSPNEELKKLNEKNLEFYIPKIGDKKDEIKETRGQFVNRMVNELKEKYPNLPLKSLHSRANKLWKGK